MKYLLLIALVCPVLSVVIEVEEIDNNFKQFQSDFERQYEEEEERVARRALFEHNYKYIVNHNKEADNGVHSYRLAVNHLSDLTKDEVKQRRKGFRPDWRSKRKRNTTIHKTDKVPSSIDWRKKGLVTAVKNQGECGCCYTFSTVVSIEGQLAKKSGKLVSLSEQNLLDCSTTEGNKGCNGGAVDYAFEYVIKNKGISTETAYPFTGTPGNCDYDNQSKGATLSSFTDVKKNDENQLKAAVANVGPISVAIDASADTFTHYSTGIYDDPNCGTALDHGVAVVGYGTQDGKDYWIVKNSWGETWGEKGYIKIARNKNNLCAIAASASYPTGVN